MSIISKIKEIFTKKYKEETEYIESMEENLDSFKLKSDNFESVELIRPLYLVREKEICHWRDYNNLKFLQCACKFTEKVSEEEKQNKEISSKRKFVKNLIADLSKKYPQIENSIFASTSNVNLAKVLEYKDKNGNRHNFLDNYSDK